MAGPATRHLLTTDGGIEDLVADELRERVPEAVAELDAWPVSGRLRVANVGLDELLRLTTVNHVVEIRAEASVASLDEIAEAAGATDFPELDGAGSFRVTATRRGEHPFKSVDIARTAGGPLWRRYGTPVSLEAFEVEIRADLYGEQLVLGVQRTPRSLGNRVLRATALRTALKPTVAAAMLRLVRAHRGPGRLIDPMCGSGTILIEARRANPRLDVEGADWDPATLAVARTTLADNHVDARLWEGDVRGLGKSQPETFDFIVSDPPYGVRQARRAPLSRFYKPLVVSLERALTDRGKIALVVLKRGTFLAALEQTHLRVQHERVVDLGALSPRIFVLEHA